MSSMFSLSIALETIDLSTFNTENVTNMNSMFSCCYELDNLDLSTFDTENVMDMSIMFSYCNSLKGLDLSNFNTYNLTDMVQMFYSCDSLSTLDISNFNTEKVTDMNGLFGYCDLLSTLDLSKFNTANVTDMSSMFRGCDNLEYLDLSNFNTVNVTDKDDMFENVDSLSAVVLSDSITQEVSDQILPIAGGLYVSPGMWVRDGGDAAGTATIPTTAGYAEAGTYRAKSSLTYTLSFDLNGISGTANDITVTYNAPIGTLPTVASEGYRLVWTVDGDVITAETAWLYMADKQAVAEWSVIDYTIIYNLYGGTNDYYNPATYTIESSVIYLDDASRSGYRFLGWYDAATGGNKITKINNGSRGDVELHAHWEEVGNAISTTKIDEPFSRLDNTLYFTQPTLILVYNVAGIMLYNGRVMEYTLPSRVGVYIICTESGTFKVLSR